MMLSPSSRVPRAASARQRPSDLPTRGPGSSSTTSRTKTRARCRVVAGIRSRDGGRGRWARGNGCRARGRRAPLVRQGGRPRQQCRHLRLPRHHRGDRRGRRPRVSVNIKSAIWCCKHVLPIMVSQQRGAIINVSSVSAFTGRTKGRAPFSTASRKRLSFSFRSRLRPDTRVTEFVSTQSVPASSRPGSWRLCIRPSPTRSNRRRSKRERIS